MAEKKTPTVTPEMNIYQRLMAVRKEFREKDITQSGLNLHADFAYFELKDIIPVAEPILAKYDLIYLTSVVEGQAMGRLIRADKPEEEIGFMFDAQHIAEPSKYRMNEAQAVGAEITYYRRYLYYLMLDLTIKDEVDPGERTPIAAAPKKTASAPATTEERKEIAKAITDSDGPANEMQMRALKAFCEKLLKADPSKEEFIQQIAVNTKSFTECKRNVCEKIINNIVEMLNIINGGANNEVG